MRLVLRVSLVGLILCCVCVAGVRAVGGMQPSFIASLFTNADGSPCAPPCLLGIQPDQTPFNAVLELLSAHPTTRDWARTSYWAGQRVTYVGVDASLNVVAGRGGRVRFISLTFDTRYNWESPDVEMLVEANSSSLGDVVAVLGAPPRFQSIGRIMQGVGWSYYVDRGLALQTRREGSRYIDARDVLIGLFVTGNLYQSIGLQQWHGFTGVEAYQVELARTRN
jgi:hypothetical protein